MSSSAAPESTIAQHLEAQKSNLAHPVTDAIQARHSTRAFKSDPVPLDVLEECLSIAQHAPSRSNLQPWRITVALDNAFQRLSQALLAATTNPDMKPERKPIPPEYKYHRSELGSQLYGKEGYNVARHETERMTEVRNRNFKFFDAPMALILAVDDELAHIDGLSAGLYLQSLCLLLQERGLSTCIEVSVAQFPQVIRKELGIAENMQILCGVAIGYEDDDHKINHFKAARDAWKDVVTFVKD